MLASAVAQVVPGLASELRERRRARVGTDVARDLADLLVGTKDAVLAAEAEQKVVAGDPGDLLRLEAEEAADPVVLVDDVVATAQVGEARERAAGRRRRPRRAPTKDLRVRKQGKPKVAPDEAAPGRRDGEGEAGRLRARLEQVDGDAPEEPAAPLGFAEVGEGDDDVEPLAEESLQLVLGLRETTRYERRALGIEGEALPLRQRGRARRRRREIELLGAFVTPDGAHLVGLPDEVEWPRQCRHQVRRQLAPCSVPSPGSTGPRPSRRRSAAG